MSQNGDSSARRRIESYIESAEARTEGFIPTPVDCERFDRDTGRGSELYDTGPGRDIAAIACELGMGVGKLRKMFLGRSVLDVGCSQGKFISDVSRLSKRTEVVGLDIDEEALSKVPKRSNVRVFHGDGNNIQDVLGDETFDFVISSYSHIFHSLSPQQGSQAISSAVEACKIGGKVIFMPILIKPDYTAEAIDYLKEVIEDPKPELDEPKHVIEENLTTHRFGAWIQKENLNTLLGLEEDKVLDLSFAAHKYNGQTAVSSSGRISAFDNYSVIGQRLS